MLRILGHCVFDRGSLAAHLLDYELSYEDKEAFAYDRSSEKLRA